jgi:hypothetical protein
VRAQRVDTVLLWPLKRIVRRLLKASRAILISAAALALVSRAWGVENDGSLNSIARALAKGSGSCPISLTARVIVRSGNYYLSFRLSNTSGQRLTMSRAGLPWESIDSIELAAVTTTGNLVRGGFPIRDNFDASQIVLRQGETLQGDYDLSWRWNPRSTPYTVLPHEKSVILMWAYTVRAKELPDDPTAVCSGITSFHTRK